MPANQPSFDPTERDDRPLRWFLMAVGVFSLTAFGAAVMPADWMVQISASIGLEMPPARLPIYLARHLSLLYGCVAVALILIAGDLPRYRPLLPWLAGGTVAFGIGQAIIDIQSGMPWWWTAGESASTVVGGLLIAWLIPKSA